MSDFDANVAAEVDKQLYLDRCAKVRDEAIGRYGDQYTKAIAGFQERGGLDDITLRSVIEGADDPAAAVMAIASNPDDHQRILKLSGPARVIAATKIAVAAAKPKQRDVEGSAAGERQATAFNLRDREVAFKDYERPFEGQGGDSAANDEKWFAERAKQKANSVGRPWSPKAKR